MIVERINSAIAEFVAQLTKPKQNEAHIEYFFTEKAATSIALFPFTCAGEYKRSQNCSNQQSHRARHQQTLHVQTKRQRLCYRPLTSKVLRDTRGVVCGTLICHSVFYSY